LVDKYAHIQQRESEYIQEVFYVQLLYVANVTYPATSTNRASSALLAIANWCKYTKGDATRERVWYTEMGLHQAINVATVQCVVGRVQVGRRWGILDLSYGYARTVFLEDPEEDGREEEEWN
jgi:hypothetical protein